MYQSTWILLTTFFYLTESKLLRRDYIDTVCSPSVAPGSPLPPCVNIINLQSTCAPSSTNPDYNAAAKCLCSSSSTFFPDWVGCQACLFYHGARTENEYDSYMSEIKVVSQAYCTGTQTDYFPAAFSRMANTMTFVTTAGSTLHDQAPSSTAVSLYYTGGNQLAGTTPVTSGSTAIGATTTGTGTIGGSSTGSSGAFTLTTPGGSGVTVNGARPTKEPVIGLMLAVGGALLAAY